MPRTALLALLPPLVLSAAAFTPAPAVQEPRIPTLPEETSRTLFFAVLEGLYEDGVDNYVVDAVTRVDLQNGYPELFVYACPICTPVYDAFLEYRNRVPFYARKVEADSFGEGLPQALRERLSAPDRDTRWKALNELVQGYIERRLDAMRLTEEERQSWSSQLADGRKQGMMMLQSYQQDTQRMQYPGMKACALCDAANGACGRR